MKKNILLLFYFSILIIFLSSHSGRTDSYGGHNDRKHGTHHYHNAGSMHAAGNPYQDHDRCGICYEIKDIKLISDERFNHFEER